MNSGADLTSSNPAPKVNILGLSAFYHDSAACLVRDGKIIAAAQEERFTRKKHDAGFPKNAVAYCLGEGGLKVSDLNFVAFYEKPFLKFDRILHSYLAYAPFGLKSFLMVIPLWIRERIWMKELIRKELGCDCKIIFPEHHESHAASAFFPSPFQEAAFLTIDGVGLTMTNAAFNRLFGRPPRKPESKLTQNDMDLARSIQDVTEEIMFRMARHVRNETGLSNLCLAGGVALNCVANGRILREKIFDRIWIQPAAGDAGGALGAALFVWHQVLGNERNADDTNDSQRGSYLGPAYSNDEVRAYLQTQKIPFTELTDEKLPGKIADLIKAGKVIGWFYGRMEFGPRALGARSIIGDARSPEMQELMNLKIKFRESFRPFAPSVLREEVSDWFELESESPYMLLTAAVVESRRRQITAEEQELFGLQKLLSVRSSIPAVTHVDYSARVQTVTADHQPMYYRMIKQFAEKSGCPVIINTSFNVRGEPIVATPADAFTCFMRTNMDYLLVGNFLLEK